MDSSDPPYEALTQQMAYLMSTFTNRNLSKNSGCNGSKQTTGNGKYLSTKFQRPKKDRKDMKCWGCGGTEHSWRECSTPSQGITSLLNTLIRIRTKIMVKI